VEALVSIPLPLEIKEFTWFFYQPEQDARRTASRFPGARCLPKESARRITRAKCEKCEKSIHAAAAIVIYLRDCSLSALTHLREAVDDARATLVDVPFFVANLCRESAIGL
jgi:hypothetical protein